MGSPLQKETKRTKAKGIGLWLSAMLLAGSLDLTAHDSPEHEIEALNKKIAASGTTCSDP